MSNLKKALLIGSCILVAVVSIIGLLYLFPGTPLYINNSDQARELQRVKDIAQRVKLPPELSLRSVREDYHGLSTVDSVGIDYVYRSTKDPGQTCTIVWRSLEDSGYTILPKACTDYGHDIYKLSAKKDDGLIVSSRIVRQRTGSEVKKNGITPTPYE